MSDRIGPPAWAVTPDPSDLPRIVRDIWKAAESGSRLELSELGVQVLRQHFKELGPRPGELEPWQVLARTLPPPTAEEIAQYADGIVYHRTADGVTLRYDPAPRGWERATSDTSSGTDSSERSDPPSGQPPSP